MCKSLIWLLWILSVQYAMAEDALLSLVRAEERFSKTAYDKGIKTAFLENLANDSVLFRPGPVNGKQWTSNRPPSPGVLSWYPTFAEISGSGDFGISTGPYEYRRSPSQEPVGYGQFLSVWRKEPDGFWKVILDAGIVHEKPDAKVLEKRISFNEFKTVPALNDSTLQKEKQEMLAKDTTISPSEHPASYLPEVIVLRETLFPAVGDAGKELARQMPATLTFQQKGGEIAASGDLGFTYGAYQSGSETGHYVHVWKKDGDWKLLVDLMAADPKQ